MLSAKKIKAIELHMTGMQKKDVSSEVGINPPTLSVWLNDIDFKETYDVG